MEPTLKNHSLVYVNHDFKSIEKEDIIVANWNNETIVKRVVGVAGDKYVASLFGDSFTLITQESQSSLNFKPSTNLILSTIPTGYYFVEGDNIDTSYDSQDFGLIPRSNIIAKVIL
jgi:signal peptidase I